MPFTTEQLRRKTEFRVSISTAITAGTIQDATIEKADLHMTDAYLRCYAPQDWTDLTDDAQAELNQTVQELRQSIGAYPNQRDAVKRNNAQLCLIRFGTIHNLIKKD